MIIEQNNIEFRLTVWIWIHANVSIADKDGNRVFEASYDAWGRQTVSTNTIGFTRGYTGHEMLAELGIINMGGRLYDPVLGRFFSPDNYVQAPTDSQNFNRYSYCLNNPLKYTDPTGEWFGIDDLIAFGVGAIIGYVSNGIKTGNWGLKSVKVGLMTGVSAWLGFNGIGIGGCKQLLGQYVKNMAVNTLANSLVPSLDLPVNKVFGMAVSPMFGLAGNHFSSGINVSLFFNLGEKNRISLSFASTDDYAGFDVSGTYKGYGAGYGLTYYTPQTLSNGNVLGEQTVGTVSALLKGTTIRVSNDLFGDGEDRWRSSAVEIATKDFVIGTYVTTNWGKQESKEAHGDKGNEIDTNMQDQIIGKTDKGGWREGKIYSAPFWVGVRKGNQILRFGYSSTIVQSLTQNVVHKLIGNYIYVNKSNANCFYKGFYLYSGTDSPVSLWN